MNLLKWTKFPEVPWEIPLFHCILAWDFFFNFLVCFYLFGNFELLGGLHTDLHRHKEESALANKTDKMTQHELHHFAVLYVLLLT